MKKIAKKQTWRELTKEETVQINGGTQRENEKQANLWATLVKYLRP